MEPPTYFTTKSLCDYAGVNPRTFQDHLRLNVGGIQSAREKVRGLGLRYVGSKCRRYIAMCHADPGRLAKSKPQPASA